MKHLQKRTFSDHRESSKCKVGKVYSIPLSPQAIEYEQGAEAHKKAMVNIIAHEFDRFKKLPYAEVAHLLSEETCTTVSKPLVKAAMDQQKVNRGLEPGDYQMTPDQLEIAGILEGVGLKPEHLFKGSSSKSKSKALTFEQQLQVNEFKQKKAI